MKRKAERPCTLAAIEYFPTDGTDFLLVAAVSYAFSDKKKNSLPGRVPSTWLAVFRSEVRNDNKTWVKQGTTESHEQIQSLGTFFTGEHPWDLKRPPAPASASG